MAEITSVLFYNVMRYDPKNPRNPAADRFVLSKVNTKLVFFFQIFLF
jgi:transketolase